MAIRALIVLTGHYMIRSGYLSATWVGLFHLHPRTVHVEDSVRTRLTTAPYWQKPTPYPRAFGESFIWRSFQRYFLITLVLLLSRLDHILANLSFQPSNSVQFQTASLWRRHRARVKWPPPARQNHQALTVVMVSEARSAAGWWS